VKAEIDQPPAQVFTPAPTPTQVMEASQPVFTAAPVSMPAPLAAEVVAFGEALARAPMAAPPRVAASISPFGTRDTFIPRAPVEPRVEVRTEPRIEMTYETNMPIAELPLAVSPAAVATAPKVDPGRIRLFDRYRSLIARPKVEETPVTPQPQAKVDRSMAGMNISVGPQDRPVTSHSEDELEIPAFLRRQAN
jgi:hypothetical protein